MPAAKAEKHALGLVQCLISLIAMMVSILIIAAAEELKTKGVRSKTWAAITRIGVHMNIGATEIFTPPTSLWEVPSSMELQQTILVPSR